jgi:hypothetical protein
VGPKACLDDVEKRKFLTLPGLELRPLGRPARSQALYRQRYPGSRVRGDHGIRGWTVHTSGQDVWRSKKIIRGIYPRSQSFHCLSVFCLYILI